MLHEQYEAGFAQCFDDFGLSKEARSPFPGEEAWKMLGKMKPRRAPKPSGTLRGPKVSVTPEGERVIDYGHFKDPKVHTATMTERPLSPKAQEAMSAFNYKKPG